MRSVIRHVPAAGTLLVVALIWTKTSAAQSAHADSLGAADSAPSSTLAQSDLEGYWTNDTYTPLERPAELAGKEFFTAEEATAFMQSRIDRLNAQPADDIHYDDAIWQAENYDKVASLRTSLIVEPRDGKLPPLTAEGQARYKEQLATQRASAASESAAHRSLAERCISWGNVGPPMMPPTYSANLQFIQAPELLIIRHEIMNATRTIYLDDRPHPSPDVQWLAGHSVGHWEGQTLVVDTTNFTPWTNFRGSPQNTRQDIFASEHMHVVERFTLTDADTIHYAFTVEDPVTWTTSWAGEMEIRRVEGPIYEYACHEGNYGLANILAGARAAERQ
jgi:hypothetical protein